MSNREEAAGYRSRNLAQRAFGRVKREVAYSKIRMGMRLQGAHEFEISGQIADASIRHRRLQQLGEQLLERGACQTEFLKGIGLEPHHRLLDYGCNYLATARYLIPYLDPGHYVGVDVSRKMLTLGAARLARLGIERSRYHLVVASSPELSELESFRFDFVFVYSVVHHMSRRAFEALVPRLGELVGEGGALITTFSKAKAVMPRGARFYGLPDFEERLPGFASAVAEIPFANGSKTQVAIFRKR